MDRFRLNDDRFLVTGAGSGIGAAVARGIAAAGGSVAVNDLVEERAAAVAAAIVESGGTALPVPGDVADPDGSARVVAGAVKGLGGLNGLVNNAGIVLRGGLESLDMADWDRVMAVNFTAALMCSRHAHPSLKEARGSIVNMTSIGGEFPSAGTGAYSASKTALTALTRQMAVEWGPDGIRANVLAPGMISNTGMTAAEDDELRKRRGDAMPLRRTGQPEEVADAARFLLSEAARFVTGQVLLVDGGWSVALLTFTPAPWREE